MSSTQGSTTALRSQVAEAAANTGQPAAPGGTLRDQIKSMEQQWANALPKTVTPDRFVRTVLTEVSKNPQLAECYTPTFLGACTMAAQLGLEFGPLGLAYLVPFYNGREQRRDCQLIIGYKGYLQLARRSGDVKDIIARPVYENDQFDFWADETGDHLLHRPAYEDKGEVLRYYGRATFTNGGNLVMVVSLADIDARRERSQAAKGKSSPWTTDPEAMHLKTVIRIMSTWLPLATEVAQGIASDEQVIRLRGNELVVEQPPEPSAPPIDVVVTTQTDTAQEASPNGDAAPQKPAEATGDLEDPHTLVAQLNDTLDHLEQTEATRIEAALEVLLPGLDPNDGIDRLRQAFLAARAGVAAFAQDDTITDEVLVARMRKQIPTASAPPVAQEASDGDPGPVDPQGPSPAPGGPVGDPALEGKVMTMLNAVNQAKLRELNGLYGVPTQGRVEAQRLRLLPKIVEAYQAGDQATLDLF